MMLIDENEYLDDDFNDEFDGIEQPEIDNIETQEEFESFDDFDTFDAAIEDIDFSDLTGDFKKSFSKANKKVEQKQKIKKVIVPKGRNVIVEGKSKKRDFQHTQNTIQHEKIKNIGVSKKPIKEFFVKSKAFIEGPNNRKLAKVIVPRDKKVIVEGVSKFILSEKPQDDEIRNIGYYKGKRLNELVLTFNNNSALDFNLQLFNPSMPLDYLYSTSLNLNDKIQVAGGAVSYSDVLYNLLANPALIVNAKFIFSGPDISRQIAIPLEVINKQIAGIEKINPLNLAIQIDNMQVANDIVFFDVMKNLNRAFIPDGMDVMQYKVLAGMTVTMSFFHKQVSLKRFFYSEARHSKKLL